MQDLIREKYLSKIRPFYHDSEVIKVLTGIRRCGKSTIMCQIMNELYSSGIPSSDIVYIDLDSKPHLKVKTSEQLELLIDNRSCGRIPRYLFIDEIQNINGFESLINAYRNDGSSVFITGSNSHLLSGELVTKLTGRFIEFKIQTFSFDEVRRFHELNSLDFDKGEAFNDYLRLGGYPRSFHYDGEERVKYIRSVIDETVEKDILMSRKVRDRPLLHRILDFVISNPGAEISSTSIAKFLRSEKIETLPSTVNRHLNLIFSAKLATKCERYDINGKSALKTLYKSYVADPAIHSVYPKHRDSLMIGRMIENVVFNELISRGYDVSVGKLRNSEVDFVVSNGKSTAYIQVAYLLSDPDTFKREIGALMHIKGGHPKYIISMDPIKTEFEGIRMLNLIDDFLLGDKFII
ncbi:MAG: ATP-binding protein [Candidatus Methanomethylophilaceae archaeon]|nr:ATP-binding protein [Candidatus Methanomethylophilaceae archaeon]